MASADTSRHMSCGRRCRDSSTDARGHGVGESSDVRRLVVDLGRHLRPQPAAPRMHLHLDPVVEGSLIVTNAMAKYNLRFDHVVLCGANRQADYDWDSVCK